ncbi:MAG: PP2C family protein-serine/threonine phosphatase [Candidatus Pacearchaeota archaeon]
MFERKYVEIEGLSPIYFTDKSPNMRFKRGAKDNLITGRVGDYDIVLRSNVGVKRPDQEDTGGLNTEEAVLVVADGMGGAKYGAEAAEFIVGGITRPAKRSGFLWRKKEQYDLEGRVDEGVQNLRAYSKANQKDIPPGQEPGAAVGVVELRSKGLVLPYHLGDVREYVVDQESNLRYITIDHGLTQSALTDGRLEDEDSLFAVDGTALAGVYEDGPKKGEPKRHHNVVDNVPTGHKDNRYFPDRTILRVTNSTILTQRGRIKGPINMGDIVDRVQMQPGWTVYVFGDGMTEYMAHERFMYEIAQKKSKSEIIDSVIKVANEQCDGNDNITGAAATYNPEDSDSGIVYVGAERPATSIMALARDGDTEQGNTSPITANKVRNETWSAIPLMGLDNTKTD